MKTMNEIFYALGRGELDPMKLVFALAESQPTAFVAAANGSDLALVEEVKRIYSSGVNGAGAPGPHFIDAIKYYRTKTGTNLVEAKKAVEKITGHPPYNPDNHRY